MKRLFIPLIAVTSFALAPALLADHHEGADGPELSGLPSWSEAQREVIAAFRDLGSTYSTHYDPDKFASLFHDEFIGWYDGDPIPFTKSDLADWIREVAAKRETIIFKSMPVSVKIAGDLAMVMELYSWTYRNKDGEEVYERGRYSSVWKKENDRWVLYAESGGVESLE